MQKKMRNIVTISGEKLPSMIIKMIFKWKIGLTNPDSMIESWQRQTKTCKMDAFCSLVLGVGLIGFMTYLAL